MKQDDARSHVSQFQSREMQEVSGQQYARERNGINGRIPIMPYSSSSGGWQQNQDRPNPTSLSSSPSISAMLNPGDQSGDFPDYAKRYASSTTKWVTNSNSRSGKEYLPASIMPLESNKSSSNTPRERTSAASTVGYLAGLDTSSNHHASHETNGNSKHSKTGATSRAPGQLTNGKHSKATKERGAVRRQKWTPSATSNSSASFSVPGTPTQLQSMPRQGSLGSGSLDSDEDDEEAKDDDDDDDDGNEAYDDNGDKSFEAIGKLEESSELSVPIKGRPKNEIKLLPAEQRARNRAAATKCRAKSKAAISKLEEDEKLVTERHDMLVAQKSALTDELLDLRQEILKHKYCDHNIGNYLDNAAQTIGHTGGSRLLWGPNANGGLWPVGHRANREDIHGRARRR